MSEESNLDNRADNLQEESAGLEAQLTAARQSLRQYEAIMGSIPDHVYFKDTESRFLRISKALASRFGLDNPSEVAGKTDFDFFSEQHARKAFEDEKRVMETGQPMAEAEEKETWPDGSVTWVLTTKHPLYDSQGRVIGTWGISRDITRRKELERKSRELEERLDNMRRVEAAGIAVGGLAHDLGNIMTATGYHIGKMKRLLKEGAADINAYSSHITAADEGFDIVMRMLAQARSVGSKEVSYRLVTKNLQEVLSSAIKLFKRPDDDIAVTVEISPDIYPADIDQITIENVLHNIFVNARDAMEGVKRPKKLVIRARNIRFNREQAEYHPGTEAGDYALVSISDNGRGMDEETLANVLIPYYSTKGSRGTGVGLTVANAAMAAHRGNLELYSEPGKGTTVNLYFRRSTHESAADGRRQSHKGAGTVFIVDDQPDILNVMRLYLGAAGYTVMTASRGNEALDAFKQNASSIDLVLLDRQLQGISGDDLCRKFSQARPGVRIMLMSGNFISDKELPEGAVGYLPKPFGEKDLLEKIRAAMDYRG